MTLNELTPRQRLRRKKVASLKRELKGWLLFLPLLLLVAFVVWFPQIKGIIYSFFEMQGYTPIKFTGMDNYINVLSDTLFPQILKNTVTYVFWSIVIGYFAPIVVAILLNEMVHFKSGFKFCIYFPQVLPGIAASLMWYLIFFPDSGGLLNMILSLFDISPKGWLQNGSIAIILIVISCTWKGMPGSMLMYYAALQGINRELYEAAVIDGAGVFRRIFSVSLPQISGTMLLMFIRQIISMFQILEQPMVMTGGGPNNATITMAYWAYKQGFENFRVGSALAVGNILFVILIIFTAFYFYLSKKVEDRM